MKDKQYIAIVRCHIVAERCSGYLCERAFFEKTGGFSIYKDAPPQRTVYMTCGGCCGRAMQRKLLDLIRTIKKKEGITRDKIVVHMSTCITRPSFHGPVCPHIDYLKETIGRLDIDIVEDTHIGDLATKRRDAGKYT